MLRLCPFWIINIPFELITLWVTDFEKPVFYHYFQQRFSQIEMLYPPTSQCWLNLSPLSFPQTGRSYGTAVSPRSGRGCINNCARSRGGEGAHLSVGPRCELFSCFCCRVINVSLDWAKLWALVLLLAFSSESAACGQWAGGGGNGVCISCHPQMNEVTWERCFFKLGLEARKWVMEGENFLSRILVIWEELP